jgi:hypothetical protein
MPQRSARVIHPKRPLAARQRDFPHRHPNSVRPFDVHSAGVGEGLAIVPSLIARGRRWCPSGLFRMTSSAGGGHRAHSVVSGSERPTRESRAPHSLRRYEPDQVPRVTSQSAQRARCPWRLPNLNPARPFGSTKRIHHRDTEDTEGSQRVRDDTKRSASISATSRGARESHSTPSLVTT